MKSSSTSCVPLFFSVKGYDDDDSDDHDDDDDFHVNVFGIDTVSNSNDDDVAADDAVHDGDDNNGTDDLC